MIVHSTYEPEVDVFIVDPAEPFPTPVLTGPTALPDCLACGDTGEVWDGRTVEHGTGMPVTQSCTACSERRAS